MHRKPPHRISRLDLDRRIAGGQGDMGTEGDSMGRTLQFYQILQQLERINTVATSIALLVSLLGRFSVLVGEGFLPCLWVRVQ